MPLFEMTEICPWELSPHPNSPLLYEKAKKELNPENICLIDDILSIFFGVSLNNRYPSLKYSPIWYKSPLFDRRSTLFYINLRSTASYEPMFKEEKESKVRSPIVPET